jgi:hypothetical protein
MRLLTDYRQFYDVLFDETGPVFHRTAFTRGGLSKKSQLEWFERLNLKTPPHGPVTALASNLLAPNAVGLPPEQWLEEARCVVYLDEFAHGGSGKAIMSLAAAMEKHPQAYASNYVAPPGNAVSYRHARIGRIGVWLRQVGASGEWRSNRADRETVLRRDWNPEPAVVSRVMWAIDFIPSAQGLLAIDFNTAPDLDTLGETGAVGPAEILEELGHAARSCPELLNQF